MITPSPPPPGPAVRTEPSRAATLTIRVLWAAIPVVSLGIAGWVPSMVFMIRRRSPQTMAWFALFLAGLVGYVVLLILVPGESKPGSGGGAQLFAGFYAVTYILGTAAHAWIGSRTLRVPVPPQPYYGYGYGHQPSWPMPQPHPHPQPTQPMPYQSAPPAPPQPQPYDQPHDQPYDQLRLPSAPQPRPQPQPFAPLDPTAAEVQAELRELRGLLDEGRA